jgi:hypothetical protein
MGRRGSSVEPADRSVLEQPRRASFGRYRLTNGQCARRLDQFEFGLQILDASTGPGQSVGFVALEARRATSTGQCLFLQR